MSREGWRRLAAEQHGVLTRAQLRSVGVDRWAVRHRVDSERWQELTPTVVCTTTGALDRAQLMWLGVLHAGGGALVGDLTAAGVHGLRYWERETVTVLIGKDTSVGDGHPGISFVPTRHPLDRLRARRHGLPLARLEPAVLMFAARQRSHRTAEGVIAAAVQQRLTTPTRLLEWIDILRPLRGAPRFRLSLTAIADGAQSVAEIDVRRVCREFGLVLPVRQVRRHDADGRTRFTDCEWRLDGGRVLVLEVDGGFHMQVEHWEDDLARQRALTGRDRIIVRCTARELRDEPWRVARDLRNLGVPAA